MSTEIRNNDNGTLDEIVSDEFNFFHMEQMDNNHWWLCLHLPGGKTITVNLAAKRASITALVETEG